MEGQIKQEYEKRILIKRREDNIFLSFYITIVIIFLIFFFYVSYISGDLIKSSILLILPFLIFLIIWGFVSKLNCPKDRR
jgi:hypothetical protein